jgi:hypothetical protein
MEMGSTHLLRGKHKPRILGYLSTQSCVKYSSGYQVYEFETKAPKGKARRRKTHTRHLGKLPNTCACICTAFHKA